MWNEPTNKQLTKLPTMGATENQTFRDKRVEMHFFLGSCDWYVCEYDGEDLFFGYVILNGDIQMGEWGYISFQELKSCESRPESRWTAICTGSPKRQARSQR